MAGRYLATTRKQSAEARLPITAFPEYEPVVEFLEKEGGDVFWTINCPGIVSAGAVSEPPPHIVVYADQ
jgi:hypothetical protein